MPQYQMPAADKMQESDLGDFTKGYITAAFWTEEERLCEESEGLRNLPAVAFDTKTMESRFEGGNSHGFDDLAPETLSRMIVDCASFEMANKGLLAGCGSDEQNGHDFWLTRNGHGAGFWDRGYGPVGDLISKKARAFGECSLYVGDDGKVYLS